jgi:hypothetical protein
MGVTLIGLGSGVMLIGGNVTHVGFGAAQTPVSPGVRSAAFDGQPIAGIWEAAVQGSA